MSDIKLTYFTSRGRVELSRFILVHAGIRFEDIRISRERWQKIKPQTVYGQLPMLDYKGTKIYQSVAIHRFLALETGIGGRNSWIQAQADMVVDFLADIMPLQVAIFGQSDPTMRAELVSTFIKTTLPEKLELLEKLIKSRGGQFMAGNELTWADLAVSEWVSSLERSLGIRNLLENHSTMDNLVRRVLDLPNIKKWIQQRPDSQL